LSIFFLNLSRKFKLHYSRKRIKGTLHEDLYTFPITSRSILVRTKHVSDKSCTENQDTHFSSITFFRKYYHLRDNVEKYCRAKQVTDDNMAHARCMLDT